jgi:hypothetical protein
VTEKGLGMEYAQQVKRNFLFMNHDRSFYIRYVDISKPRYECALRFSVFKADLSSMAFTKELR